MNKPLAVISCPIDTFSGYGARSRDFVKALHELKKEEWDIKILPQRWGSTRWGYIKENIQDWSFLNTLLIQDGVLRQQPDYWFQITVPNEFQKIGKMYNVGITAGIETTICDKSWIDGCNRMDLVLASSKHAKNVLASSIYEERNQQGVVIKVIALEKENIKVLFEGIDTNKFKPKQLKDCQSFDLYKQLDAIKESFNFLVVGHYLPGNLGHDRKNIGRTIKTFLETFKDYRNPPGLILKVSGGQSSIMDRDSLLEKINAIKKLVLGKSNSTLPNVYLLHGDISEEEMSVLYSHEKVKCLLSFTKGEGFGRPILEFSLYQKPIIVSGWSGHTDFLNPEFVTFVDGVLENVDQSAHIPNMLLTESMWFSYDESSAKKAIKNMVTDYKKYSELAKRQAHFSKTNFSYENMKQEVAKLLESFPSIKPIKLPELKKISQLPKLQSA